MPTMCHRTVHHFRRHQLVKVRSVVDNKNRFASALFIGLKLMHLVVYRFFHCSSLFEPNETNFAPFLERNFVRITMRRSRGCNRFWRIKNSRTSLMKLYEAKTWIPTVTVIVRVIEMHFGWLIKERICYFKMRFLI